MCQRKRSNYLIFDDVIKLLNFDGLLIANLAANQGSQPGSQQVRLMEIGLYSAPDYVHCK